MFDPKKLCSDVTAVLDPDMHCTIFFPLHSRSMTHIQPNRKPRNQAWVQSEVKGSRESIYFYCKNTNPGQLEAVETVLRLFSICGDDTPLEEVFIRFPRAELYLSAESGTTTFGLKCKSRFKCADLRGIDTGYQPSKDDYRLSTSVGSHANMQLRQVILIHIEQATLKLAPTHRNGSIIGRTFLG